MGLKLKSQQKDSSTFKKTKNIIMDNNYTKRHKATVLSIAGSDSGGGAGIQADIKAISACGAYAATAITALTIQNTIGVKDVFSFPTNILQGQIEAVLEDIGADAVKVGMLHNEQVVELVRTMVDKYDIKNLVVDPVMVSTSGHKLIEDKAIETLKKRLLTRARVITPNIPEAEIILNKHISSQEQLPILAKELSEICSGEYKVSVLLKAGHLSDNKLIDIFYNAESNETLELESRRLYTVNTHGTGCTLSSAFAAFLAKGYSLNDSANKAKEYITKAIESGSKYTIGKGNGPVDHFFMIQ